MSVSRISRRYHGRLALIIVVSGRAFLEEVGSELSTLNNCVGPLLLRFSASFNGANIPLHTLANHVREMLRLFTRDMHEVGCEDSLNNADPQAVWKAIRRPAMKSCGAFLPLLRNL